MVLKRKIHIKSFSNKKGYLSVLFCLRSTRLPTLPCSA